MSERTHNYPAVRAAPTRRAPPHVWSQEEIARMTELKKIGLKGPEIAGQMEQDFNRPYSKSHINCKLKRIP